MLGTLSFIKSVGVIHCDLKPENILFTDDKNSTVKVILCILAFRSLTLDPAVSIGSQVLLMFNPDTIELQRLF